MQISRALGAAVAGLVMMLVVSLNLVIFGAVAWHSPWLAGLLVLGLLGGAFVGWLIGTRRHRRESMPPPPAPPTA